MPGVSRVRTVLFVDDDEKFLSTVALLFQNTFDLVFAGSGAEARELASAPDVAFVDLGLPDIDGVELVRELGRRWQDTPLVVLTVNQSDARVLGAFQAGARGYVLKEDLGDRLERAVEEALEGGAPMSAAVARKLLRVIASLPDVGRGAESLTDRERDVVRELAGGHTYEGVAARLGISIDTLRGHVRSTYRKLSVNSRTEAVIAALRLGLLERR